MRFKKIIIENFGPFKKPTTIDFKDRDGVNIVWGRNGRGKTTILNAFNFVLNNTVKDRDGNVDNFISFINEKGRDEGKYSYKVTLDLEENNKLYRIIRSLNVLPGVGEPKTNSDVQTYLSVNEDGNVLSDSDSQHFVNSIMTKEVSRFFLFDGELLTEYEELLNESSETGGSIKKSIEQILGMPILTYGVIDISNASAVLETEARKVAQNEKAFQKHLKAIDEQNDMLTHQKEELARLTELRNEAFIEKKKFENLSEDSRKIREYTQRKQNIIEKIENQNDIIVSEKENIFYGLQDSWRWMITPVLTKRIEEMNESMSFLERVEKKSKDMQSTIEMIQKAIDEDDCPICNHSLSSDEKHELKKRIQQYQSNDDCLSDSDKALLIDYRKDKAIIDGIVDKNDKSNDLISKYNRYSTAKVKISDYKENDLKEIENDLDSLINNASGIDEKQAFEYFELAAKKAVEVEEFKKGIEEVERQIEDIKQTIKKLDETIRNKSKNKDVDLANKKVKFAEDIESIFRTGIDEYRDKLSKDVEKDATEIFMKMNTEEDYGGLVINDNYGLTIIRKSDGKPVPKRSAGWEHMVAFALIGALHKNAPFDGPVIMDSPFYRLDTINTASMIKALPSIANQVLMLPYPGEINEKTTRTDIGSSIIQELEIRRISSNESTIEEKTDYE